MLDRKVVTSVEQITTATVQKRLSVNSTICRHQRIHCRDLSQKLRFLGLEIALMGAYAFSDAEEPSRRT